MALPFEIAFYTTQVLIQTIVSYLTQIKNKDFEEVETKLYLEKNKMQEIKNMEQK